jgi:5-methylcytosine-specific restriction endonuclease McrA
MTRTLYGNTRKVNCNSIEVQCFICDRTIYVTASEILKTKKFQCSKPCTNKKESRECVDCDRIFEVPAGSKQKRCGSRCPSNTVECICENCKQVFMVERYIDSVRFCTEACRKDWFNKRFRSPREHYKKQPTAYNSKRKRVMLAGEYIDSVELFELYGWKCHLCGELIDKELRLPNDMAATIDHVVPISLGGQHIWDNVAPAHAFCNFRKGNVAHVDQLV